MSARYVIALQRIKDAERFQECNDQISWAANEMASILKDGDPSMIDLPITWAGLAMAHRVEHEIAATCESGQKELAEVEERALYTLKQVIIVINSAILLILALFLNVITCSKLYCLY